MPYNNYRRGGGKPKGSGVRLTGLFKTKRQGLYVGSVNEEKLQELIALIKKAKGEDKEITVFLWKSKFQEGPLFSLNMDIAQDKPKGGFQKRRPIEDDPDDEPADKPDEDDDDPFAE